MPTLRESRKQMIFAMGSRCAECGKEFPPDNLIIHHVAFEEGHKLGYGNPVRYEVVYEYARTGKLPDDVKLLCDSCNRKRHNYRPSRREIFGDR
jgi:hypothetical protein